MKLMTAKMIVTETKRAKIMPHLRELPIGFQESISLLLMLVAPQKRVQTKKKA